ncbi:MAG TPA: hypothetical protein DCW90_06915 [Lachnospiraceae bacterium]|nr:hypothetical protein [Lachnospiraceae bacterium]
MQITTKYDVGDSVWTSIYTESDGLYHTFHRTITYIKITHETIYGFSYGIECVEENCFDTLNEAKDHTGKCNDELKRWENI